MGVSGGLITLHELIKFYPKPKPIHFSIRKEEPLKNAKKTAVPKEFIVVDTETSKEFRSFRKNKKAKLHSGYIHRLYLGYAVYVMTEPYQEKWLEAFTAPHQFWDWVEEKIKSKSVSRTVYLFSHNAWFDFSVLHGFTELTRRGWKLVGHIIDTGKFSVKFQKNGKNLFVVNTYQLFPTKLKKLGEVVGLKKMDVNLDEVEVEQVPLDVLKEYCRNDVEILKKSVLHWFEFIKKHDLGSFKITLAGQSFAAFRKKFLKNGEIVIHNNPVALDLERRAYRGGRTECFRIGRMTGEFYKLDINSEYPFVMKTNSFPCRLLSTARNVKIKDLRKLVEHFCVIADVEFQIDEPAIGIKLNGKLIFPVGYLRGVLCTPEIEYLLENRCLTKCHTAAVYIKKPIFGEFVDHFYSLRQKYKAEKNSVYEYMCKIIMNSLYGKFGQRVEKWYEIGEVEDHDLFGIISEISDDDGELRQIYVFGGKAYMREPGVDESGISFPAIAAEVTAHARMYLWRLIKTAGIENVFYCDTDSLFTNREGYERLEESGLIHDKELGALKLEETSDYLEILAPKCYTFGTKKKIKGIREKAKPHSEKSNTFIQEEFWKMRRQIQYGLKEQFTEIKEKQLKFTYDKGIVDEDGTVRPLYLNMR